jgi:hypothetical protein
MSRAAAAIVAMLWPAAIVSGQPGVELQHEFRENLGIFDVSADGSQVLLHQNLKTRRVSCTLWPCGPYVHRILVEDTAQFRTVASIDLVFEGFERNVMAFLPGTDDVLLRGHRPGKLGNQFLIWSPKTGRLPTAPIQVWDRHFEFVEVLEQNAVLLSARWLEQFFRWNPLTGEIHEIPKPPLRPYFKKGILGAATNRDGLACIVSGPPESPVLECKQTPTDQPLFRVKLPPPVPETEGYWMHLPAQLAVSPAGNAVAVAFEVQTPAFGYERVNQKPKFAVYSIPGGNLIGLAEHPPVRSSISGAAVSSPIGGKLRFSPDGSHLYTTVKTARQWKVRLQ